MNDELLTLRQQEIRGTDSNSLLRLYDVASAIVNLSPSQHERTRADRVVRRLAKELQRRNVPLELRPG
jgi:hypothetical protein